MYLKFKKTAKRHRMGFAKAFFYEIFVRLYRMSAIRLFFRPFFTNNKPSGWFFLVGCYNSGTTVIKDAVALHPMIATAPIEGDNFTSELSNFEGGGWPRCMASNSFLIEKHRNDDVLDASSICSNLRPWVKKGNFFLEKSISNSVRMNLLRQSFQGCKFVCVFREPSGVIRGILKRSKPSSKASFFLDGGEYTDEILSKQWVYVNSKIINDYRESDSCFCSYEGFLSDPVKTLKDIYKYLGLPPVEIILKGSLLIVDGQELPLKVGDNHGVFDNCLKINDVEDIVNRFRDSGEVQGEKSAF